MDTRDAIKSTPEENRVPRIVQTRWRIHLNQDRLEIYHDRLAMSLRLSQGS